MVIKKKNILIIEDDPKLSEVVVFKLKKMGFNVKSVLTAEEGLDYLGEGIKPHLIWLDLYLPGMNGYEFLQELKKMPEFKDIPVVVVTCSYGASSKVKQAFSFDVAGYFVKTDFDLNYIVNEVKKIVNKK